MPVYQNKQTKKWKYRVYATDIFGNRKQFEKEGNARGYGKRRKPKRIGLWLA